MACFEGSTNPVSSGTLCDALFLLFLAHRDLALGYKLPVSRCSLRTRRKNIRYTGRMRQCSILEHMVQQILVLFSSWQGFSLVYTWP